MNGQELTRMKNDEIRMMNDELMTKAAWRKNQSSWVMAMSRY
jgi:hypothetical protein